MLYSDTCIIAKGEEEKSFKLLSICGSGSFDSFMGTKFRDKCFLTGRMSATSFLKFLLSSSVSFFKFSKLLTIY